VQKNIADAYHNVGMTDKAIYHYEKAIKLNAKFDEAYYNLSVLLYLQ
jgi:tetratricopeptide (TPR) repeat protein